VKWKKIRGYQLRAEPFKRGASVQKEKIRKWWRSSLTLGRNMLSPVSSPLNPSVSRVTSVPSPSRPPKKDSGLTSAEAHDPEWIVDWPCHSLREEEQDRRRSWLFRAIKLGDQAFSSSA
jgi:hypothetical protein